MPITSPGNDDDTGENHQPTLRKNTAEPVEQTLKQNSCSPDNAAAEGFFGRMKTESVYPEHWEKRTRDEVLVLIDEYIHWYNHERIKQSLGWMSPVQYRQSQGMAA